MSSSIPWSFGRPELPFDPTAPLAWLRGMVRDADRSLRVQGLVVRLLARYRVATSASTVLPEVLSSWLMERAHADSAGDIRATVVELRGALVKVAQFLSTRGDLLPEAYTAALAPLQDQVPPRPFAVIRGVLERELGARLAQIDWIDPKPLATASIAQVHRAKLWDGRDVVLKVQPPRTRSRVSADLTALMRSAWLVDQLFPPSRQSPLAAELARHIAGEVDFVREADFTRRMRAGFAAGAVPGVRIPDVVTELTTSRVLVLEFLEGERMLDALERLARAGDQAAVDSILTRLVQSYAHQIFHVGLFQADPHPGNFLLAPDGTVILLDFGCCAEISAERRVAYTSLATALALGMEPTIRHWFHEAGFEAEDEASFQELLRVNRRTQSALARAGAGLLPGAMPGAIAAPAAGAGPSDVGDTPSPWPTQEQIFRDLTALLGIHPPADFALLSRVFATLGGTIRTNSPRLNLFGVLLPYLLGGGAPPAPSASSAR